MLALLFCLAWVAPGRAPGAETAFERDCAKLAASQEQGSERLRELFKLHWDYQMREFPEFATSVGYPGQNDRWTDWSLAAIERRKRELQEPLKVLATIDRARLNETDRLSFDLFKRNLEERIEGTRFPGEYLQVTQLDGVHQDVASTIEIMPANTAKHYEDILARLRGVPKLVDQIITLLEKGRETGVTPPRITLRDVSQQVKNQMLGDALASPILAPFRQFPRDITADQQERLRKDAVEIFVTGVRPVFRKLHDYLAQTYIPAARESIACSALPDGRAWYAFNARHHTTTRLTPRQIHETGLAEVKRIRVEMEEIIKQTGFKGDFAKFAGFLRTDSRFYFKDTNSLLVAYRDIAKRIDPELTKLFGKLPRLPYGVLPVPAYAEKSQTTAYYRPGSPQAGRPGNFYANTYNLKTRPKWEMEALTVHEAVPGHHLQIALAQELEGLPEFRKHGEYTAFVEGWGLYSESLGGELGLYKDPYSKFGQLTYEMWRAIRLVVDTGMHDLDWSREQAITFFKTNSSKAEHDIVVEVDRYIVWPGQALAYKMGELKIKELRGYAKRELGGAFDIRVFHDELLGNGALPLDLLEAHMQEWVVGRKKSRNIER